MASKHSNRETLPRSYAVKNQGVVKFVNPIAAEHPLPEVVNVTAPQAPVPSPQKMDEIIKEEETKPKPQLVVSFVFQIMALVFCSIISGSILILSQSHLPLYTIQLNQSNNVAYSPFFIGQLFGLSFPMLGIISPTLLAMWTLCVILGQAGAPSKLHIFIAYFIFSFLILCTFMVFYYIENSAHSVHVECKTTSLADMYQNISVVMFLLSLIYPIAASRFLNKDVQSPLIKKSGDHVVVTYYMMLVLWLFLGLAPDCVSLFSQWTPIFQYLFRFIGLPLFSHTIGMIVKFNALYIKCIRLEDDIFIFTPFVSLNVIIVRYFTYMLCLNSGSILYSILIIASLTILDTCRKCSIAKQFAFIDLNVLGLSEEEVHRKYNGSLYQNRDARMFLMEMIIELSFIVIVPIISVLHQNQSLHYVAGYDNTGALNINLYIYAVIISLILQLFSELLTIKFYYDYKAFDLTYYWNFLSDGVGLFEKIYPCIILSCATALVFFTLALEKDPSYFASSRCFFVNNCIPNPCSSTCFNSSSSSNSNQTFVLPPVLFSLCQKLSDGHESTVREYAIFS